MLAAGVPMAIVSKMLRHSSIGITVDTYGHLSEDTARTAADAMGALLNQAFRAGRRCHRRPQLHGCPHRGARGSAPAGERAGQ
jgi:hypothetical protein